MKIYYAHHTWKYGTPIEEYELQVIRDCFECEEDFEIVNPKETLPQGSPEHEIMQKAHEAIGGCDTLVFSTVSGMIGHGVFNEVILALNLGIPVFCMVGDDCFQITYNTFCHRIIFEGDNRVYALVKMPHEYEDDF